MFTLNQQIFRIVSTLSTATLRGAAIYGLIQEQDLILLLGFGPVRRISLGGPCYLDRKNPFSDRTMIQLALIKDVQTKQQSRSTRVL